MLSKVTKFISYTRVYKQSSKRNNNRHNFFFSSFIHICMPDRKRGRSVGVEDEEKWDAKYSG